AVDRVVASTAHTDDSAVFHRDIETATVGAQHARAGHPPIDLRRVTVDEGVLTDRPLRASRQRRALPPHVADPVRRHEPLTSIASSAVPRPDDDYPRRPARTPGAGTETRSNTTTAPNTGDQHRAGRRAFWSPVTTGRV